MANEINIYQPRYLAEVVRQAPAVHTFFRDKFFKNIKTFATERVDIDIVKGDRRMAAFVHPRAGGQVLQLTIRGFSARTPSLSLSIRYYTEEIMALGDIVKRRFIQRIHQDGLQRSGTTLFTEICYVEEQLIDYCDMVADALIRYGKEHGDVTDGETGTEEEKRKQVHELFRDKFEMLEKQPS